MLLLKETILQYTKTILTGNSVIINLSKGVTHSTGLFKPHLWYHRQYLLMFPQCVLQKTYHLDFQFKLNVVNESILAL